MPALINRQQALEDGIYAADEGRGPIILGAAVGEILVSIMRVGVDSGVSGSPKPGREQEGARPSVGKTICHTISHAIYGLLP